MGALAPQPRLMAVGAHVASAGAKLRLGHEIRLTSVRPVGYLLSLAFTRLKRASPCMRGAHAGQAHTLPGRCEPATRGSKSGRRERQAAVAPSFLFTQ